MTVYSVAMGCLIQSIPQCSVQRW